MNQQTALNTIANLVEDFKTNELKFLSPNYSEADVRKDFIDKFFNALGWDVYHNEQKNPYEQEVKIERGVTIGRQQKRADYAFYLLPNFRDVKFFVEAKKPSRNLNNADDYFQSCRYGWNAGTQITFLTDFEEFIVLDCRTKPDVNNILNNKIKSYRYEDYLNEVKFAEIYWLISREAVANNSLEKFAESLPKPKGKSIAKGTHRATYQSIDDAFLEELDEIRDSLAKAFKKANEDLGSAELTEMTQRTIDRLVFIRFLEDRQIEPDHFVSEFGKRKNAWTDFINASRNLDAKYNGIVFKKHAIDTEKSLAPDDKSFAKICEELAHKNSPYNFDIIPIHILGSIYERFLGKVVVATDKRVRIEEKPEVRKAGGVYYTPQYIVNYIVDNTVGKLIDGKKPSEIAKMRFADISCGSGSFLITVFERLLEYHKKWYQQNPEQAQKDGCILHDGRWVLSLKQKQNILLNNVYGVDLDPQAIEVTQLSLYLKLLEDETTATANDMMVMFKEQILPSLNNNIVCGNSLIGTDILENNLFENVETLRERLKKNNETHSDASIQIDELKLKPMNFEDVFPHIFKKGNSGGVETRRGESLQDKPEQGFDAIVGNPPYIQSRDNQLNQNERDYYYSKYSITEYQINTYGLFIEKSLNLLKHKGLLSYIIPNYWLANNNDRLLRNLLLYENHLEELINVYSVFKNAIVDTLVFKVNKEKMTSYSLSMKAIKNDITTIDNRLDAFQKKTWGFDEIVHVDEIAKVDALSFSLRIEIKTEKTINDYYDLKFGVKLYEVGKGKPPQKKSHSEKRVYESKSKDGESYFPLIRARDVQRYLLLNTDTWINYGIHLAAPRDFKIFLDQRILVQRIISKKLIDAVITNETLVCNTDVITIKRKSNEIDDWFFLGILCSQLASFYVKSSNINLDRAVFPKINTNTLSSFPVPSLEKVDIKIRAKISSLAMEMQNTKLKKAKTEADKEYLEMKCAAIDRQIDQLVYELYGLTEEEIIIVEESLG